ncbi:site-specific tyrosine recombinase XerD, partial [bacterium]
MDSYLKKFILFIKFELRLSHNTVTSYQNDLSNYLFFLKDKKSINNIESIS